MVPASKVAAPAEADPLQGGELGFVVMRRDGFVVLPCPWSALRDLIPGPYASAATALAAVSAHLAARTTPPEPQPHG